MAAIDNALAKIQAMKAPFVNNINDPSAGEASEACKALDEVLGQAKDAVRNVYAGGLLGTTFNSSASAFEDPAPAVEKAGLTDRFKYGEYFFERSYTQTAEPFDGLGPLYIRNSCQACHPGYGHGKRMERYRWDDWGNGYLLVVYDKSNDAYLSGKHTSLSIRK